MTKKKCYVATLLATSAIAAAISQAPVALADSGNAPGPSGSSQGTATPDPAPPPVGEILTGVDPLVPNNSGANPILLSAPGYDMTS